MAAPIVTLMLAPALTLALALTLIRSLQMAGRTSCAQTPKCASLMLLSCTCAHTLAPNPHCATGLRLWHPPPPLSPPPSLSPLPPVPPYTVVPLTPAVRQAELNSWNEVCNRIGRRHLQQS